MLAQVPDLNDFVAGMRSLLKPTGVDHHGVPAPAAADASSNQFDTIYHEHFSYFSLLTVEKIFAAHGMTIFDVEELGTHGGSLRIYGSHRDDDSHPVSDRVASLRRVEARRTPDDGSRSMDASPARSRRQSGSCCEFLITAKAEGKAVAGYGAPGKGNTLLNYCGIRTDFLDYTVDRNPYKHGKFTPGTHIPIFRPEKIDETRPDYVLILPWNLKDEIIEQMARIRAWGGKFVVPIPEVSVID